MPKRKNMKLKVFAAAIALLLISVSTIQAQLVNPNATPEAMALKQFIDSVYGHKIISGQCDDKYLNYIETVTGGKAPAIMGYDFNGICPSQGGNNDADKAIRWVKDRKGIAQFQWHWISPNADGDWSSGNFKLAEALADTTSQSYLNMIRDIDLASAALKKMQDSLVPVLWRPLHEAEGAWFWWGMAGKDACISLYRLMYDRMVNHHGLNNLIWIWNSYGTDKPNWYPGDDVVDIIAWDYPRYTGNNNSWSQYQQLFANNGKPFGIGEDGRLTDPEILDEQPWLYFLTWAYMIEDNNTPEWINQVYNDPRVITLDDMVPGPKAKPGFSRTLFDLDDNGSETTTLNGSSSYTNNGNITAYKWTLNGQIISQQAVFDYSFGIGIHSVTLTVTSSTGETGSGNVVITVRKPSLSLSKPVQVSSTENNFGNVAAHGVDGDASTRWSSQYADPQWFTIDLKNTYHISQVIILWEVASAKDYKIQVSDDGISWNSIADKINMAAGARKDTITNMNGTGRYIRMHGSQRNTSYGYSFYEFEVYGSPANSTGEASDEDLKVLPLQEHGNRVIRISSKNNYDSITYKLINSCGACLQQGKLTGTENEIKLSQTIPDGFYLLQLAFNGKIHTEKIIIN